MIVGTRDGAIGRIVIELFNDEVPKTSKNSMIIYTLISIKESKILLCVPSRNRNKKKIILNFITYLMEK